MKVIFTGDPVEIDRAGGLSRVSTSIFGVVFPMSVEVDVSHLPEHQRRKLLNNPHFRAAGIDAAPVRLIVPTADLRGMEQDAGLEEPASEEGEAEEGEPSPPPPARLRGKTK